MELLAIIWWKNWFNRNRVAHEEHPSKASDIVDWARDYLHDCHNLRTKHYLDPQAKITLQNRRWSPPNGQTLKLNTDAAIEIKSRDIRLGMIVCNCHGQVLMSASKGLLIGGSSHTIEALAIWWGLQLALSTGLNTFWVESDAKGVVKSINNGPIPLSEQGLIIQDILESWRRVLAWVSSSVPEAPML